MDGSAAGEAFVFEGFRFDRAEGQLFRANGSHVAEPLTLGSRAAALIELLVERPGKLVTKDEIFAAVWPGMAVAEANLTALRRILDEGRERGGCIQTLPGRGYRFVAPVTRAPLSPPQLENDAAGYPEPAKFDGYQQIRRRIAVATVVGGLCLVVTMIGGMTWRSISPSDDWSPPRLSIVVLPFANLSGNPEQQYFADAITEDLTADLSRVAHMFVISRSTAFTYRDKRVEPKQIGRELGVRYVLEGSVLRFGTSARVNVQLVEAKSSADLWAEQFCGDTIDLFALQSEITTRISVALDTALVRDEVSRPTENLDALDFILRGRAAGIMPSTRGTSSEQVNFFERALALDPRSVEAKRLLAVALAARVLNRMTDTRAADIARADELVEQALLVSPRNTLAHYAKALTLRIHGRYEEAVPELEMVIEYDPNASRALANLGLCKLLTGSIDETIPLLERAIRLSPRDSQIGIWYDWTGRVHLLQSRTDEAVRWFERARVANPKQPFPHSYLASAYALRGETERAAAELSVARNLFGDDWHLMSIARLRAAGFGANPGYWGVPKIRSLFENTYFVGLRKAGVPEE